MRSQIVGGTVSPSALPKYQSKQARQCSQLVTMTRNSVCVRSSAGRYWRLINRNEWSFLAIFFYLYSSMSFKSHYHCLASLSLFFAFSFRVLMFSPGVPPFSLVLVPVHCWIFVFPLVVDCYRPTCPLASTYIWSAMSMVMFWFGLSLKKY